MLVISNETSPFEFLRQNLFFHFEKLGHFTLESSCIVFFLHFKISNFPLHLLHILFLKGMKKKCKNKSSKLHPFYLGKKHYKTWRKIQTKTKLENLRSLKMRVWIYSRFWIDWNYNNEENWKYLYRLKMYEFYWKYLNRLKLF